VQARARLNPISKSCASGVGLGLIAAALQWAVQPLVGSHVPFIFYLPALAFTAASFGRIPALIVLLMGALNAALLAPPVGSMAMRNVEDLSGLVIYLTLGVLLVMYAGRWRLVTRRAALAETRLALAQDDTGVGVYELDFQAGTAYVSPGMSQLLGQPVSLEPIPLAEWLGALSPEQVADARSAMQERLSRGEYRYEREQRVERPNGEVVWLLNRVQLEATAAGVLTHARGASVDITARKKIDDLMQAAAKTEQRFSVALESSVVPFSILAPVRDEEGRIVDFQWTYLNPAATRAFGRDGVELVNRRVGDTLPRAWDAPGLFDRYVRIVETGEPNQFELCTSASNQGTRWYHVVASPLHASIAVWFANITDRKLHEESLEAAAQRKDEFLATLAHELRNPLAAIRQGVRIARAITAADAQKRWGHAVIERQVNHMSLLLDDLLDVARVGRGTLLLRKSQEALAELVDTAVETARPHIEAKRHHLTSELPSAPVLLEVDPLRIAQVIGNLLINAAKYTDPGGQIRVRVDVDAEGLVIRIKDNGIGLTQEQISQVFDMFAQIPGSLDKSQGGLGIGLALARGLVELHDGSISVSSAGAGKGAEFSVRLPKSCVVRVDEPPQASSNPSVPSPRDGSVARILIADDNRDGADSLAELLRIDGHDVYVAYEGRQALATFEQVLPDVALLDVGMPGLTGLDVVRSIRQHPAGARTVLIAVTGRGEEKDRHRALEAGFDHLVTKPTDPERIQALIELGRASRAS
jgi:signal transduction histidine kinase/CheY-like chemotaxis protein